MTDSSWESKFKDVFDAGVAAFQSGRQEAGTMFNNKQIAFLATIGCKPQELFDFVEDHVRHGEPDFETALQVAAIRRRYFQQVQHGIPSQFEIDPKELPEKKDSMGGIVWLPRIIAKARAKLRGELDAGTMYGCGGDRPFLAEVGQTLPGFLQLVWDAGENDLKILEAVKASRGVSAR